MTVRISKMWVLLKDFGHQTPGHERTLSLVLKAHLERQKPGEGRRSRRSLPPFLLEIWSHPPPTAELLKCSEVGHPPRSLCFDRSRGAPDGIVTTALSGVCLWVPSALAREDDLRAIWGFGKGFAIVVIPHPGGVVRISKQLVVSEKECVRHLLLDSRIGGLYAASKRQRAQQCCQRHNQRSRHSQQRSSPLSPLRCAPYVGRLHPRHLQPLAFPL